MIEFLAFTWDVHFIKFSEIKLKTECEILREKSPIERIGATPETQCKIDYAYHISKSIDFVLTCDAENGGTWNPQVVGPTDDYGLCQISQYYHPHIVNHKSFENWKFQLWEAKKLYQSGTKFYANPNKYIDQFIIDG